MFRKKCTLQTGCNACPSQRKDASNVQRHSLPPPGWSIIGPIRSHLPQTRSLTQINFAQLTPSKEILKIGRKKYYVLLPVLP